mgnify:CR=1 FL=1
MEAELKTQQPFSNVSVRAIKTGYYIPSGGNFPRKRNPYPEYMLYLAAGTRRFMHYTVHLAPISIAVLKIQAPYSSFCHIPLQIQYLYVYMMPPGHIVLNPDGRKCFCGGRGCWSAYCALTTLTGNEEPDLKSFFQMLEEPRPLIPGCAIHYQTRPHLLHILHEPDR